MKVTVLYVYIAKATEPDAPDFNPVHERFVRTLREFYPSIPFKLLVSIYGSAERPIEDTDRLFSEFNPEYCFSREQGFDISAYASAAFSSDCDFMVCCNSQIHFHRHGWLERLVEAFQKHGKGLYSPFGSYENSPHLRGPCMAFPPKLLRAYHHIITNRIECHKAESGEWNVTAWVKSLGLPTMQVTWDGEQAERDWRKPDNVFRKGDQSSLLLFDRHSKIFDEAAPTYRRELTASADGLNNRKHAPQAVVAMQRVKTVTIVGVTSLSPASHAEAINRTAACIPHPCRRLLISPTKPEGYDGDWTPIPEWMPDGKWSLKQMCDFLIYGLHEHIKTDVCVLVQWDGYAMNPDKWTDDFLNYDYVGAPWPKSFMRGMRGRVGNGGFSIRSKKWLELASKLPQPPAKLEVSEDMYQSSAQLAYFEKNGCKVAPLALAQRWSLEHNVEEYPHWKLSDSFGFHGLVKSDPARKSLRLNPDERTKREGQTFFHTGDLGDIIAALPLIRSLGGGELILGNSSLNIPQHAHPRERMTQARYEFIKPLLEIQPYITKVSFEDDPHGVDFDFSDFRTTPYSKEDSLVTWQARHIGLDEVSYEPWLTVPFCGSKSGAILSRSLRYRNPRFNWRQIASKECAGKSVAFMGTDDEWKSISALFKDLVVGRQHVANALEAAHIIAESALFIGNQSFFCWVAMAIGTTPLIQETWPKLPNSRIPRSHYRFIVTG